MFSTSAKSLIRLGFAAALCFGISGAGDAFAKDKVKVGFIGPLTGGNSANGLGGRNSAELAVLLRNKDEKAKYEYEFVALDDECKPNVAVQQATKMAADEKVIGAATHYCSSTAIATVDTYHKFGLPVIVWGAVLPDITYGNDYKEVHRVNGTMINQNQANAELVTKLGYKKFVVIHDTTDYGKGHNKYFSESLKKQGGEIVGTFGVTAEQQDFTAELTQAKSLNPDAIYFGGLTPIGVRIRAQMDKLGMNDVLFDGTSGIVSDTYIDGLGKLAEGTFGFKEGAPTAKLPGGKFFLEKYEAQKFDNPAEAYGPFAFAAMNLIIDAIEEVGPDRKKVREVLNKTKDHDSIVGKVTFDDHGQNSVAVISDYVVQDGKWVLWSESEYESGKRKLPGQK